MYASPRRSHQIIQAPSLAQTLLSSQLPPPHTTEAKPLAHILSDTDTCGGVGGVSVGEQIMAEQKKKKHWRFGLVLLLTMDSSLCFNSNASPKTGFQKYPLLRAMEPPVLSHYQGGPETTTCYLTAYPGPSGAWRGGVVVQISFPSYIFKFL